MAVNLSPIWGAGAQLLDNSGNVLSGGKIYTYAAGTTTQVATYTSNTGGTANSNPIILNSAGRVPYEIWLTDGQNYKFVLKDSNDVLIGTWDNLSGINSNFIAYTNQQEIQTATAGQTVFNLTTMNYLPGTNSLSVFVDGVNQYGPGAQYAYEETDSNTVTFASGLHVGAEVKFTSSQIQNAGAVDASQVSYTPPFTNSVSTNVEDKLAQYVSVKDFGAVGDGVSDDTTAIQNALDSMVNGGTLYFPVGTYKITDQLSSVFNNNVVVNIIGYGAKIDGTAITGNADVLLTVGGERLTGVSLASSVTKGDLSITTSSAISSSKNDIALVTSTDLWNPTRPYYYKGEFIELENISGTTISCANPLYDSYTSSTTTVYALSMPTVIVEGIEFISNSTTIGLNIEYCRNPSAKNLKIHGTRYTGLQMKYCFGGVVDSCEIYDVWDNTTGVSYGIGIATCQNFVVSKNNITEARHCISGGGWEPCRNIIYANNICTVHPSETVAAALDHHGNMEFCAIVDNVANGGIQISSINSVVKNNIINESRSSIQAILVFQEINSDFYEICENSVTCNGLSYGIHYSPSVASNYVNRFAINGNNIKSVFASIILAPRSNTITGCVINTLAIKNNICYTSGSDKSLYHGTTGAAYLTTLTFDSANNIYKSANYDCASVLGSVGNLFSSNDKYFANRSGGYLVRFDATNVDLMNPYFEGNTGGSGNSRSIYYVGTGTIRVVNPTFTNLTYKAEIASGGPSLYIEQGWYESTPTILNTGSAKLVNFFGTLGRATTYGTAAPVANTWAVGDRVINQTPVVGQPKSWVCTVAGTPGTWVSEGNL